jgi:hypothetical protein
MQARAEEWELTAFGTSNSISTPQVDNAEPGARVWQAHRVEQFGPLAAGLVWVWERSRGRGWATGRPCRQGVVLLLSPPVNELNLMRRSIDACWKALQNSLSGLFCASLGSMDALHTTSPVQVFLANRRPPAPSPPCVHPVPRNAPR